MKIFKIALVILAFVVSLAIAPPSWADQIKLTKSPDYTEITQALDQLLKAQQTPEKSGYTSEEIQEKIGQLRWQKYILETASNWARCRNETGQTLAVYAHEPKKSLFPSSETNLYFLGNGKITDDDWNCDGIYLPSGTKVAGLIPGVSQPQELTEPLALKIVPGTQLVAKTNPDTGAIELNVPPSRVFKAGETNWSIPDLALADITAKKPNAPIED